MTVAELKKQVGTLLQKDKIKDCLQLIAANLKEDASQQNTVILQQRRLATIKEDTQVGLLSYEDQSRLLIQLSHGIIGMVEYIEAEDLRVVQSSTLRTDATTEMQHLAELANEGLRRQMELLQKKINRTRETLALEDDPTRQIRYETQLEVWEEELAALKQRSGL